MRKRTQTIRHGGGDTEVDAVRKLRVLRKLRQQDHELENCLDQTVSRQLV